MKDEQLYESIISMTMYELVRLSSLSKHICNDRSEVETASTERAGQD